MMKPLMLDVEIRELERALLSAKGRPVRVLEWGSGGSTVYFTDYLRKNGVPYEWVSLEYNKKWHEKVSDEVKNYPHTSIVLFDVGNDEILQPNNPMNEYVSYPKTLGKKFDVVFVDGRKRRRCVIEAKDLVTEGGVVFLHDAERPHYHSAFTHFPRSRFLSGRLWLGTLEKPNFFQKVADNMITFIRRFGYTARRTLWKIYASTPLRDFLKKNFS